MSVIQALQTEVQQKEEQFDSLVEKTVALVSLKETPKLGLVTLTERSFAKGDLILDPEDKTVYVVSGKEFKGMPLAINEHGKKLIDPRLALSGSLIQQPSLRQLAAKLSTKYPTRRVYVYGAPHVSEDVEQPTVVDRIITPELMVEKKKGLMDPGTKPSQDPLHVASLKAYMKALKGKKDIPKPSTKPHPWQSYVQRIGDNEYHDQGDNDPGNAICPKEAKKKGVI